MRNKALAHVPVIGDGWRAGGGKMPILIKPFIFLIAFGPMAVLFASVIALACLLLMTCVRAIAWLPRVATEILPNAVNSTELAQHEPQGLLAGANNVAC